MSISAFNLPDKDAGRLKQHPGQDSAEAVNGPSSLNLLYSYLFASPAQTVGRLNLSVANRFAITAAAIERPRYASLMQHNTQDNHALDRGRATA